MSRGAFAIGLLLATTASAAVRSARLPDDVVPRRYTLTLAPDLAHGRFSGHETVDVDVVRPTARVTLHAAGLALGDVYVVADGQRQTPEVEIDDARQTITLVLRRPLATGTARLLLGWSAPFDDDLVGFYRVDFGGRHYAFTDFEPAHARGAFPCFDEPGLKANVALTALVDASDDAISNAPIAHVTPLPGGKQKLVQFAETGPLSPYLVALAVGRFAAIERVVDGVTLRLLAAPETIARGAFALDEAAAMLRYYASYFDSPYPFAKLDLVAVPRLIPGGMENAGAIFFRDDRLLLDRGAASPAERRAVARIVAHELAHQWLGDLVTPRWWNDLWLSEATATFAEREALAALHPDWRSWLTFQERIDSVLAEDELRTPRAVRAPIADGPAAREAFDGTTYVKGAAVLHMLDGWLGAGSVRRALSAYVAANRDRAADADAFFAALDEVTGRPASRLARAWLERPGHPLLTVSARCTDGALGVTLSQSRATVLSSSRPELPWALPVTLRWPGGTRQLLLDEGSAVVSIAGCPAWVEANAERSGFYRVHYSGPLAVALARAAPTALDDVERLALLSDSWADTRAGTESLTDFLTLVGALQGERSPDVMAELGRHLTFIDEQLLPDASRADFARFVAEQLSPQYRGLGLENRDDDDDDARQLRAQLIDLLGRVARVPEVLRAANSAVETYLNHTRLRDPVLTPVLLQVAAHQGDGELFRRLVRRVQVTRDAEEQRRYVELLAAFEQPDPLRHTLNLLLTPLVPSQDLPTFVATLMAQSRQSNTTVWEFLRGHFDAIERRMPWLGWLLGPAAQLCDERAGREVTRFFGEKSGRPTQPRQLQNVSETIAECVDLRRRAATQLAAWQRSRR